MSHLEVEVDKIKAYSILIIFFGLMMVACLPNDSMETITVSPRGTIIETREHTTSLPTPRSVELATETPVSTPNANPLPTETITASPLPSATVVVLQKASILPISGTNLAISSDSSLLAASNTNSGILYVFDVKNQKTKWGFDEDNRVMTGYTALSFSSDSTLLAGGGLQQDVFVWDMNTGNLLMSLPEPLEVVNEIAFSSDNEYLAVASWNTELADASVSLWDLKTEQLVSTLSFRDFVELIGENENQSELTNWWTEPLTWWVSNIVFVPGQDHLLAITIGHQDAQAGAGYGALYFWDIGANELREVVSGNKGTEIGISPDGRYLIVKIDYKLHLLDLEKDTHVLEIILQSTLDEIAQLSIANNGVFAIRSRDGHVNLWNSEGEFLTVLENGKTISNIVFTQSNDLLVASYVGNTDELIELWRIDN